MKMINQFLQHTVQFVVNIKKYFKLLCQQCLEYPLHASIFIVDFVVLLGHRPPIFVAFFMLSLLVVLSVFLGLKMFQPNLSSQQ